MLILVKQNPSGKGEDDHQRRIDERRGTQVWLQIPRLGDPMGDECQGQPAQDADHPRREVRAENIDRWRMITGELQREKGEDEQHQSGSYKFANPGFHLPEGLTAPVEVWKGLTAFAEGLANSPVLKASAVAEVKIAA